MGSTNFLRHNPNKNNQLSDGDFSSNTQRTGGYGVDDLVPSSLINKQLYQSSIFCAAMAQAIANKGYDVLDTDYNNLVAVFGNMVLSADQIAPMIRVPWATSMVFDASQATGFDVLLAGAVAVSQFVNARAGQEYKFAIRQDAVNGQYNFAWPSEFNGAPEVFKATNAMTVIKFIVTIDLSVHASGPATVS